MAQDENHSHRKTSDMRAAALPRLVRHFPIPWNFGFHDHPNPKCRSATIYAADSTRVCTTRGEHSRDLAALIVHAISLAPDPATHYASPDGERIQLKSPKEWVDEHSQSGTFDCVGSCVEAQELVSAIQGDVIAKVRAKIKTCIKSGELMGHGMDQVSERNGLILAQTCVDAVAMDSET